MSSIAYRQLNPWIFFIAAWVGFLISACQNKPAPPDSQPDVSKITQQRHWITASFMDALNGMSDSLSTGNCMEVQFDENRGDSLLMIVCDSDASLCAFVGKDPKTLMITSGLGEDTASFHLNSDGSATLSGGPFEDTRFVAMSNIPDDIENPIFHLIAKNIAGNYVPLKTGGTLDKANPILLSADGKIKGMKNAETFEIPVGGDLQAYNGNIIYFNTPKGTTTEKGWTLRKDTLTLWNLKNMSGADEVPYFEREKLYEKYLKQH
jgi:hypothetical protein